MNKPKNEPLSESSIYGAQLRYVTRRRLRKILRKHPNTHWRYAGGKFYSWLRPL